VEQFGLRRTVALADDEFQPPVGQVVERRVVLERPDRVKQAERRHRGEQCEFRCPRCDVAQHDRR
jgi:hypothetical protein